MTARSITRRLPWLTLGLVTFLTALFWLVGPMSNDSHLGVFIGGLVSSGEVYRLVTAGFLHTDWPHLANNVVLLLIFGWVVEPIIGAWRTALLLFGASILGYASIQLLGSYEEFPLHRLVGSSGAIWGLIGASMVLIMRRPKDFSRVLQAIIWMIVGVQLLGQIQVLLSNETGTSEFAGAVGLLAACSVGLLFGMVFARGHKVPPLKNPAYLRELTLAVAVIILVASVQAVQNEQRGNNSYLSLAHAYIAGIAQDPEVLDRITEIVIRGSSMVPEVKLFTVSESVGIVTKVSPDRKHIEIVASLINEQPGLNIHALVYEDGIPRGLLKIKHVGDGSSIKCPFDQKTLYGHDPTDFDIQPVWLNQYRVDSTSNAQAGTTCTLTWVGV